MWVNVYLASTKHYLIAHEQLYYIDGGVVHGKKLPSNILKLKLTFTLSSIIEVFAGWVEFNLIKFNT